MSWSQSSESGDSSDSSDSVTRLRAGSAPVPQLPLAGPADRSSLPPGVARSSTNHPALGTACSNPDAPFASLTGTAMNQNHKRSRTQMQTLHDPSHTHGFGPSQNFQAIAQPSAHTPLSAAISALSQQAAHVQQQQHGESGGPRGTNGMTTERGVPAVARLSSPGLSFTPPLATSPGTRSPRFEDGALGLSPDRKFAVTPAAAPNAHPLAAGGGVNGFHPNPNPEESAFVPPEKRGDNVAMDDGGLAPMTDANGSKAFAEGSRAVHTPANMRSRAASVPFFDAGNNSGNSSGGSGNSNSNNGAASGNESSSGSTSPAALASSSPTEVGPNDPLSGAVVIFHNLRSLRKSPRGFLREEMDLSVQVGHILRSIKVLREPDHHEFVNVFEFNIHDPDEVSSSEGAHYVRYTANLNAALTRRLPAGQKKRARVQTPISQNETVFRLNNAARGVGTPYRLEVTVSNGIVDIVHKSEIFRVFGPTSEFGRTTHQDKMNCLSNEQGLGTIRKVSRETIEEMMPEIITTVRLHLLQHKEAQRMQRNRQLEYLLHENKRLQHIVSTQLQAQQQQQQQQQQHRHHPHHGNQQQQQSNGRHGQSEQRQLGPNHH